MACLSSCPSGVRYDKLIEETRHVVEDEHSRPRGERMQRRLLFATLPHPRRMRWALRLAPLGRALPSPAWARPMLDVAPHWRSSERPPAVTPARPDRVAAARRVGLLTGCVQSVLFGDVNAATARVLAAAGMEVVAPKQGCCGALSAHAGRAKESARFTERLRSSFAGLDTIVVNASGCGSHLKDHDVAALDVTEALADAALPRPPTAAPHRRVPGLMPPTARAAAARRLASRPRADPRPRGRRAGRAGALLRLGRDLQRHPAGGGARARRSEGRQRPPDRARRLHEREPRVPGAGLTGAREGGQAAPGAPPGRAARRLDPRARRVPTPRTRPPLTGLRRPSQQAGARRAGRRGEGRGTASST